MQVLTQTGGLIAWGWGLNKKSRWSEYNHLLFCASKNGLQYYTSK